MASHAAAWHARLEKYAETLPTAGGPGFEAEVHAVHPLVLRCVRGKSSVFLLPTSVWERVPAVSTPILRECAESRAVLVLLGRFEDAQTGAALGPVLASLLDEDPSAEQLNVAVARALDLVDARQRSELRARSVEQYKSEMGELVDIARAMTTERNVDRLLGVILQKSRMVTGADAGSVYVVETDDKGQNRLRFKLTQNDSVQFDWREFTMPISTRSIAGAVAAGKQAINIEDVYDLPPTSPFGFDQSFDQRVGYTSRSVLTVPLISQRDEVIGVIQLINRKKSPELKVRSKEDVARSVIAFDARSEELVRMVAAQAAVSLENTLLYEEIKRLFDGFVRASVEAIESRDPTTSGHSRRVADLTTELALALGSETSGTYKEVHFSTDDIRELEYASLLHDFGKIGVREKVLVKAKKLYDERLDYLRGRFDYAEKAMEVDLLRRRIRAMERGTDPAELALIDKELDDRRGSLQGSFKAILAANEPTVLAAGDFARIEELAKETFFDARGEMVPLLDSGDVTALSVKRGSLTPQEYEEITSHVTHTFRFLSQIPWGKHLRRVPLIAGAHHERLNGTGYPNRLRAEEIPVQSKIMSIADIYDALTASDRPYKKAVPVERALDILEFSVKDGHVDGELVRIFRDGRIWERAMERTERKSSTSLRP